MHTTLNLFIESLCSGHAPIALFLRVVHRYPLSSNTYKTKERLDPQLTQGECAAV
jgi:hypothetical protein